MSGSNALRAGNARLDHALAASVARHESSAVHGRQGIQCWFQRGPGAHETGQGAPVPGEEAWKYASGSRLPNVALLRMITATA